MKFFAKGLKFGIFIEEPLTLLPKRQPCPKTIFFLGDDWFHHVSMNVGQSKVATLIPVGQAFVVDSQKVQYGGVKIVNMNSVLRDVV